MPFISTVDTFLDGVFTHPLWGGWSIPGKANRREPFVEYRTKDGDSTSDAVNYRRL